MKMPVSISATGISEVWRTATPAPAPPDVPQRRDHHRPRAECGPIADRQDDRGPRLLPRDGKACPALQMLTSTIPRAGIEFQPARRPHCAALQTIAPAGMCRRLIADP
jgi:hypothetical protein